MRRRHPRLAGRPAPSKRNMRTEARFRGAFRILLLLGDMGRGPCRPSRRRHPEPPYFAADPTKGRRAVKLLACAYMKRNQQPRPQSTEARAGASGNAARRYALRLKPDEGAVREDQRIRCRPTEASPIVLEPGPDHDNQLARSQTLRERMRLIQRESRPQGAQQLVLVAA